MAKLFLSYAREDAAVAARLARSLESAGHDVWWDRELHGGASFGNEIERQLRDCEVVVVLWSAAALQSPWVHDEAAIGRDAGKLLPIGLDGTTPPIGFRKFHTLELGRHRGRASLRKIEDGISRLIGGAPIGVASESPRSIRSLLPAKAWIVVAAIMLIVVAGWLWLARGADPETTIAVVAAEAGNPAMSRDYAQSIATDMAAFLPARSDNASVLDPDRAKDAAYRFSVSVTTNSPTVDATLALMARGHRGLLWSRSWSDVDLGSTDLKKQMALTASQALMCALQATDGRPALQRALAGSFIHGCVGEGLSEEEKKRIFTRITREQPDFAPAWVELATAYAKLAFRHYASDEPVPAELAKPGLEAVRTALRLNPRSGRAVLAQLPFVAKTLSEDIEIHERAVATEPENGEVHHNYASALRNVGRMRESVEEARRAVELDPLSPSTRAAYIAALTYGASFEQARREIAEAERIWPNSDDILRADYGFNLRYGDPKRAETLLTRLMPYNERGMLPLRLLLRARAQPTRANIAAVVDRFASADDDIKRANLQYGNQVLMAYGSLGLTKEAFDVLNFPGFLEYLDWDILFRPEFASVRRSPRFMAVAARIGLVDYWRSSGHWPDFCRTEELDYNCKTEAAKYR